jgi:transposase
VRVPDGSGRRAVHLAEFATTVRGLLALADWLKEYGVTHVAMEATGVYWQPVWHVLEENFELTLVNARDVKNVSGRKTDVSDAQWLCQLMEAGLLRSSFVPPKPQRQLRALTRYRKTQIAERQREASRLHKALEDTGIKLGNVASDIMAATSWASPVGRCSTRSLRARPTPRSSLTWRRAGCVRNSRRCAKRWKATSKRIMR